MGLRWDRSTRLAIVIAISLSFFIVEIAIGFKTHSIALIADAFHYLSDILGFVVQLAAEIVAARPISSSQNDLTYGWQRATLLGGFFNGVFLLGLGISILLQSVERFITLHLMEDPKLVVIVGAVGLGLNIICLLIFHDHGHSHGHSYSDDPDHSHDNSPAFADTQAIASISNAGLDEAKIGTISPLRYGVMESDHTLHRHTSTTREANHKAHMDFGRAGVLLHIATDALNNVGVIVAGLVIWKTHSPKRYYADPAISVGIALMIIISAIPLIKRSGHVLLQSSPPGVNISDIEHDLQCVPGIVSAHELHVWRLTQEKALATVHVVTDHDSLEVFTKQVKTMNECFHAYGIHSVTIQPELSLRRRLPGIKDALTDHVAHNDGSATEASATSSTECRMVCGTLCEKMSCCG